MGLVGLGDAGAHHARAILACDGIRWTAIASRDPTRQAAFRVKHGVPETAHGFSSLESLLTANAVDMVVLATPDGAHAAQVEACARAGIAVLVEKPLALTLADAERAVSAARDANSALAVGYHLRHHSGHRAMRDRLASLGALRSVSVRWAWPDPAVDGWRARGDVARHWSLAALGTHAIDLALFFTGSAKPERIAATRFPDCGADRAAEVSFVLGDVLVHVSVAVTHRAISRVVLTGDDGELEALGTLGAHGTGNISLRGLRGLVEAVTFSPVNPYAAQLAAFVARIDGGFEDNDCDLANLVVLDAVPSP